MFARCTKEIHQGVATKKEIQKLKSLPDLFVFGINKISQLESVQINNTLSQLIIIIIIILVHYHKGLSAVGLSLPTDSLGLQFHLI